MKLAKTYNFDAAHKLPDHESVHGHSYEVEIMLESHGGGDYVVPMDEMDEAVKTAIAQVNNIYLNSIMNMPTMENIARWFWKELEDLLLVQITILRSSLKMRCIYDGREKSPQ